MVDLTPSQTVPRRTRRRADNCVKKIEQMGREWRAWKQEPMTVARVRPIDYLALSECGYINDGRLSGTNVEVKSA